MNTDVYILMKDLPGVQAGTKSEISGGWYAFKSDTDQHNYSEGEVKAHPDWFDPEIKKPPLGIISEWLHKEQRLKDLREAATRYSKAGMEYPEEWSDEIILLEAWLTDRKNPNNLEYEYTSDDLRKAFIAGEKCELRNDPKNFEDYLKSITNA